MTLKDDVHAIFAPLGAAAQATLAEIDAAEAALARMDPEKQAALLSALGLDATKKRQGAEVFAIANKLLSTAQALGFRLAL